MDMSFVHRGAEHLRHAPHSQESKLIVAVHHPVPQHVSTVPQLRSPPPPQPPSQPQSGYGYGSQGGGMPQQGGGFGQHPAFGGFINDPSAQLGLQMGQTAFNAGQQYIDQNVSSRQQQTQLESSTLRTRCMLTV
jgi:hypothetical protein